MALRFIEYNYSSNTVIITLFSNLYFWECLKNKPLRQIMDRIILAFQKFLSLYSFSLWQKIQLNSTGAEKAFENLFFKSELCLAIY